MLDLNQNFQVSQSLLDSYEFRLPSSYVYADYIWPGNLISEEKLKLLKDYKFQPNDILIVTYPKSGSLFESFPKFVMFFFMFNFPRNHMVKRSSVNNLS